ncbi:hypothetical protein SCA04_01160 [Staphylococcus carnosus]|nr:hypothetical protein SCA04_01160 [Staphylococcus carnosus]GEP79120.1 hypothetical protein SCA05_09130 [Staphylococcus carnosus]
MYIQFELRGSAGGDELWEFSSAEYWDNNTLLRYIYVLKFLTCFRTINQFIDIVILFCANIETYQVL